MYTVLVIIDFIAQNWIRILTVPGLIFIKFSVEKK